MSRYRVDVFETLDDGYHGRFATLLYACRVERFDGASWHTIAETIGPTRDDAWMRAHHRTRISRF